MGDGTPRDLNRGARRLVAPKVRVRAFSAPLNRLHDDPINSGQAFAEAALPAAGGGCRLPQRSNLCPGVAAKPRSSQRLIMTLIETRGHQMFPVLDAAQVETARRFASAAARTFAAGEHIYEVGSRHTPSWLVLEGTVDVVSRDGLQHEAAITGLAVGQFSGEVNQLAGRGTLTAARAGPHGCTAVAVRCRPCARAGDRRRRGRRDRHAGIHPAPRWIAPGGQRGLHPARPAGCAGSRAPAGFSGPQRLSLHGAGRFGRRGRPRRGGAFRRRGRRNYR